jgi:cyclopropane fatty-acyl-phospholipid synthase-like methyltransferase
VEQKAIRAIVGANGYTTVTQAKHLIEVLRLKPETWLLDIGAGRGWPGPYIAERSGCGAVVTDIPRELALERHLRAGMVRVSACRADTGARNDRWPDPEETLIEPRVNR